MMLVQVQLLRPGSLRFPLPYTLAPSVFSAGLFFGISFGYTWFVSLVTSVSWPLDSRFPLLSLLYFLPLYFILLLFL